MLSFGETYYGPNNSLNVHPFFVGNATIRAPIAKQTTVQVSVDNLSNTLGDPLTTEYAGTNQPFVNGQFYSSNANVVGPRIIRFSLTKNFGSR